MNPVWLMRMARWVRHPPSWVRVKLVVGVVLSVVVPRRPMDGPPVGQFG